MEIKPFLVWYFSRQYICVHYPGDADGLDCGKLAAILLNAAYRIVESMETRAEAF